MIEEKNGRVYLDGKLYFENYEYGTFISNGDEIVLYGNSSEKNRQAHFHFKVKGKSISGAIGIYEPIYVKHRNHNNILPDEYINDLIEYLNSHPYICRKRKSKLTVWEKMRLCWNGSYGTKIKPEHPDLDENDIPDFILPDYTQLNK